MESSCLIKRIVAVSVVYFIVACITLLIRQKDVQNLVFAVLSFSFPLTNLTILSINPREKHEEAAPIVEPPHQSANDLLEAISQIIYKFGEKYPKKHGSWICLRLTDGFFSMDSWNGAIHYFEGEPEYNYWTGFSSEHASIYLGLSNDSWRSDDALPLAIEDYKRYYDMLNDYIDRHVKKDGTS